MLHLDSINKLYKLQKIQRKAELGEHQKQSANKQTES
jgi:hypothetical protein